MAKDVPFKAYDLNRRNLHKIPMPPVMISRHRIVKREWEHVIAARRRSRSTRNRPVRLPSPAKILRAGEFETCEHCSRETSKCAGAKCYQEFSKGLPADFIDLKGPGPLGYAVFTKPGVKIEKGQTVGEYIGELRPLEPLTESMYKFIIPYTCVLDSETAGNWTRFINSHCKPNLDCKTIMIGKRRVISFIALKNIGPEEELTFNYGLEGYFEQAGFACACSYCESTKKRKKVRKVIAAL